MRNNIEIELSRGGVYARAITSVFAGILIRIKQYYIYIN